MKTKFYVGATPPPIHANRVREVLINEMPVTLEQYLNDRITWYGFDTRSEALAMVEKLQLMIESDLMEENETT